MSDNLGHRWQHSPLPIVQTDREERLTGWRWIASVGSVLVASWLVAFGIGYAVWQIVAALT